MAYTTIKKPSDYFNTVLYTGNNSSPRTITGVGFQPDMNWSKIRSEANDHWISDAVRGANKIIRPNTTDVELVDGSSGYLSSFNSDGYVIAAGSGTNDNFNKNSGTMASWNWKAGGGAGSSNTDGSITSTVSVNTTSGFSIVSYTGTGSNGTVGHGLGVTPKVIITKARTNSGRFWGMYHASKGNTGSQPLNDTQAFDVSSTYWQDTNPTSSVFSVGINGDTNSSSGMIAYCFAEKTGYSKFGSYIGNASADGPFVYTGFKPAFVIFKRSSGTGNWQLIDNKRLGYNVENRTFYPNSNVAEQDEDDADILSNGFKLRGSGTDGNGSGSTYIYMALGQSLVGSNNIPATAR